MPPPAAIRQQQQQQTKMLFLGGHYSVATVRKATTIAGIILVLIILLTHLRFVTKEDYYRIQAMQDGQYLLAQQPPPPSSSSIMMEEASKGTNNNQDIQKVREILEDLQNKTTNGRLSLLASPKGQQQQQKEIVSVLLDGLSHLVTYQTSSSTTSDESCQNLQQELETLTKTVLTALDTKQTPNTSASSTEPCPVTTAAPLPSLLSNTDSSSTTTTSSTTTSSLSVLWQELSKSRDSNTQAMSRVVANAVARTREVDQDEITMVTHVSANKMNSLILLEKWWGGPMSVAVWIKNEQGIDDFYNFVQAQQEEESRLAQAASYHVLMEYNAEPLYPHNKLRNLAVKYIDSDYFLTNDADIVTKPNAYQELMALMRAQDGAENGKNTTTTTTTLNMKETLQSQGLLVVPTFERFLPEGAAAVTEEMLPRTKQELIEMRNSGTKGQPKLEIFYLAQNLKKNQGPTDYKTWFRNNTDIYYPITYQLQYEPYIIGYKHGAPQYWEPFRGFGWNKITWFMEADAMGYQFYTLRDFFMVHRNHKSIRRQNKEMGRNRPHWEAYKNYLKKRYKYKKI